MPTSPDHRHTVSVIVPVDRAGEFEQWLTDRGDRWSVGSVGEVAAIVGNVTAGRCRLYHVPEQPGRPLAAVESKARLLDGIAPLELSS